MSKFFICTTGAKINPNNFDHSFKVNFEKTKSHLAYFKLGNSFERLNQHIEKSTNSLLLGSALAGKTRIIYEVLKTTGSRPIVIANHNLAEASLDDIKGLADDCIIVLDSIYDIVNYAKIANKSTQLSDLLREAIKRKFCFIMSCRFEHNFDPLSSEIADDVWNDLAVKPLIIKDLRSSEQGNFIDFWQKETSLTIKKTELGNNIGEYFLKIKQLPLHFNHLKKSLDKRNSVNETNNISLDAIKALIKAAYLASFSDLAQRESYLIPISLIKEIADNILQEQVKDHAPEVGYNPFQDFFGKQPDDTPKELSIKEGFAFLSDFIPDLTLLDIKDDNIAFDSTLLATTHDIIERGNNYQGLALLDELKRIFKADFTDFTKKRYELGVIGFNRLLGKEDCSNSVIASGLIAKADAFGVKPDLNSYVILIKKLFLASEIIKWANELTKAGHKLDLAVISQIIIKKLKTLPDLKEFIVFAKQNDIKIDLSETIRLINNLKDWSEQKELLKIFEDYKITIQEKDWDRLLSNITDGASFKEILDYAAKMGQKYKTADLVNCINKFNRWRDIQDALALPDINIKIDSIKFDKDVIAKLIENTPVWEESYEVLKLAEKNGVGLKKSSLQHLFKVVRSEEDAFRLKEDFTKQGIPLGKGVYNFLILKSRSTSTAISLFKEMLAKNIIPDIITYSFLFKKLPAHSVTWYYNKLLDQGITPNYSMFRTIIGRTQRSRNGLKWLHEMIAWGINPSFDMLDKIDRITTSEQKKVIAPEIESFRKLASIADNQRIGSRPAFNRGLNRNFNNSSQEQTKSAFISYSHAQTKDKDLLVGSLSRAGIDSFFDLRSSKYKDTLEKFDRRIMSDKHFVCIITTEYLTSPYCMVELYRAIKKFGSAKKISMIWLDKEKLQPEAVLANITYWQDKEKEWKEKAKNIAQKLGETDANKIIKNYGLDLSVTEDKALIRKIRLVSLFLGDLKKSLSLLQSLTGYSLDDEVSIENLVNEIKSSQDSFNSNRHQKRPFISKDNNYQRNNATLR
ncbi:MAG: TIR domain-containing protein [SAR324 cluster bacterium]|nr:TIR domain-containing protein [SAR324 cluster bacterium]